MKGELFRDFLFSYGYVHTDLISLRKNAKTHIETNQVKSVGTRSVNLFSFLIVR